MFWSSSSGHDLETDLHEQACAYETDDANGSNVKGN